MRTARQNDFILHEGQDTELNVCLDSDDLMPEDAVASILEFWERHGSDRVAGLELAINKQLASLLKTM